MVETTGSSSKPLRSSLSRRLLWLTFGVVLLAQVLFLLPAIARARRDWLFERITYGQLAVMSLSDAQPSADLAPATGALTSPIRGGKPLHDELLRAAGVEAVRLEQADGNPLILGTTPRFAMGKMIDLSRENGFASLRRAVWAVLHAEDRLVGIEAPGPVLAGTRVMVVFRSAALTSHLRGFLGEVAGPVLLMALLVGLFVYLTLQVLLVQPMRRLTDSIAAFRADPERTPPLETTTLTPMPGDEVAAAGHELAQMQRELRAALWRHARLAALGTAVAKVSHDLRSMLSPAMLAAERLERHEDAAVRRIGETVVRAIERATDLMRGGLEFAREGPIALVRRRFLLQELVGEVGEQVRATAPSVEIEARVAVDLELDADRDQIERVLSNLIRNAAEAGATRVTIDAFRRPSIVEIIIRDNGPGLPPDVETALFKPFVHGGRRGGTGLGLAIARDLMRAHLGDVELEATGPSGTRFRLTVPAPLALRVPVKPVLAKPAA